jgi:hypothetical protein
MGFQIGALLGQQLRGESRVTRDQLEAALERQRQSRATPLGEQLLGGG